MNLVMVAMWVLMGLLAGLLAEFVMKRGDYGLRGDIILGLVGSLVGGWIFWALGISPGPGMVAVTVVAFVGANIPIVTQRKIWPTIA
jgi:uncharacterized membrane protein YeaQ/YmgE (transglycosylase-associated protein family)